ncbi:hypothetical protein YC2023_022516 [Brassica napus]
MQAFYVTVPDLQSRWEAHRSSQRRLRFPKNRLERGSVDVRNYYGLRFVKL